MQTERMRKREILGRMTLFVLGKDIVSGEVEGVKVKVHFEVS